MLLWYLGTITNQNDGNYLSPSFWVAFSISIGIALFLPVGIHLMTTKGPPPKIRVKITNKGIRLIGAGRDRTLCFADIAVFYIAKAPVGESFVNTS